MRFKKISFSRNLIRLWLRRDGTVALMFGLIVMVLIGSSAIAIDYSRLNRARAQTSAALDAASLATAKALRLQSLTDSELGQLARSYFDANLRVQGTQGTTYDNFTLAFDREENQAVLAVDATIPTTLGRVFDVLAFKAHLSSQAIYSARDIELGMMLDVSGSMAGAKVVELQRAAKDLVNIILDSTQGPTQNRIGIAPYSTAVNAGEFAQLATNNPNVPVNTCVTERPGIHAFKDSNPFVGVLGRKSSSCTGSTIVPLTDDITTLEYHINQLSAGGSTAGHLGIAWAWYIVSPNWASFWPAASTPKPYEDPKAMKAVLIMTDGEFNTAFENGNGNSVIQAQKLCANIQAADVKVFAVGFDAPPAALAILQQCASKPSYFFDAKNGTELREAFTRIANELTGLRLTQ